MKSENNHKPMAIELPSLGELQLPNGKPKAKDKKAMAEAAAFAKFGIQVIRVKARVLAALGKEAEQCGIKQIGHGRILLASENAEAAIARLGAVVDKITAEEEPDYELVLQLMELQHKFNHQLIKTAVAHFSLDREIPAAAAAPGNAVTVPYPVGAPVMLAIGKAAGT